MKYEYDPVLHETSDNGGAYVFFPWDIRHQFGKGRMKVHVEFDGIPYDGCETAGQMKLDKYYIFKKMKADLKEKYGEEKASSIFRYANAQLGKLESSEPDTGRTSRFYVFPAVLISVASDVCTI